MHFKQVDIPQMKHISLPLTTNTVRRCVNANKHTDNFYVHICIVTLAF